MQLGVRHEVDSMLDTKQLAEMTVTNLVVRLQYLQYLISSVLERAADLHRLAPVSRVVDLPLLR